MTFFNYDLEKHLKIIKLFQMTYQNRLSDQSKV